LIFGFTFSARAISAAVSSTGDSFRRLNSFRASLAGR